MKYIVKRCVTLIEMMIVMFLIALIIGVVAYNYQGTLEEGKAFKTKAGKEKLETILNLVVSERPDAEEDIEVHWVDYVKKSPLVQNSDALIKDGWGKQYEVKYEDGQIKVTSRRYEDYKKKNPSTMFRDDAQKES